MKDATDSVEKEAWAELLRNCELTDGTPFPLSPFSFSFSLLFLFLDMYNPGKPWHDPYDGTFPFVKMLEDNWEAMRDEALKMREDLMVRYPLHYLSQSTHVRSRGLSAIFASAVGMFLPSLPSKIKLTDHV